MLSLIEPKFLFWRNSFLNKVLLKSLRSDNFLKNKSLKMVITYLIENVKNVTEPVLLAFDAFDGFARTGVGEVGDSLILNLLKSDKKRISLN